MKNDIGIFFRELWSLKLHNPVKRVQKGNGMKQRERYDREAVGMRLRTRRKELKWSRKYVADRIGLGDRYYADIERGTCGMSVESLISLANLYGFSIDGLLYGERSGFEVYTQDQELLKKLESLSPELKKTCKQILKLFVEGILTEKQETEAASPDMPNGVAV